MKRIIFKTARALRFYENNEYHRVDGPAVINAKGSRFWFLNGKLHRVDGPALEWSDGSYAWCENNEYHRLDGPAYVDLDVYTAWFYNGKLHRCGGPAIEYNYGSKEWHRHGILHREDGPAIEWRQTNNKAATSFWYINGNHLTKEITEWFKTTGFNPNYNNWTSSERLQFKLVWG